MRRRLRCACIHRKASELPPFRYNICAALWTLWQSTIDCARAEVARMTDLLRAVVIQDAHSAIEVVAHPYLYGSACS
eukprot:6213869-Pleurochrysis_carterae.AAC.2